MFRYSLFVVCFICVGKTSCFLSNCYLITYGAQVGHF
nr:MAG TPA: hypothetical protein [Caudoviricetes sp.]